MSEGSAMLGSMKELERQIRMARKSLALAIEFEELNGYDAMFSMERTHAEGFLEALEFIYILQNGHEYSEDND